MLRVRRRYLGVGSTRLFGLDRTAALLAHIALCAHHAGDAVPSRSFRLADGAAAS
jgi:hypothetical protein